MTALALHTISDEPRVLDTDLAERLCMKAVRNIRTAIIKTNRAELEDHGELHEASAVFGKRGPKAKAFYLNEAQALLVCMFSRTAIAAKVLG